MAHSLPSVEAAVTPYRKVLPCKNRVTRGWRLWCCPPITWAQSAPPSTIPLWSAGTFSVYVPFQTGSHPAHLKLITLCARDNYTLGKGSTRPPGTCLREKCSVPCDQSSEHFTHSPCVFQSESTRLTQCKSTLSSRPLNGRCSWHFWEMKLSPAVLGSHIFLTLTK